MSTTKNAFAVSMFDTIRDSLKQKESTGNTNFRDILKFEAGNTYLGRLVPNVKNPEKTFFHYFNHGWNSKATGQYFSVLCPSTVGEACPICQERFRVWNRGGTEEEKEAVKTIKRKENWLVNFYVISDPTSPDNEGKVKIMRYGAQINKKIDSAINGDDKEEFGAKIFDLTENGCTFRIKAEKVSENARNWTSYTDSRFLSPGEIPGMTDEKLQEIYNSLHNLEGMEKAVTYLELKDILKTHYFGEVDEGGSEKKSTPKKPESKVGNEDDEIDMSPSKKEAPTNNEEVKNEEVSESSAGNDEQLDKLLAELN